LRHWEIGFTATASPHPPSAPSSRMSGTGSEGEGRMVSLNANREDSADATVSPHPPSAPSSRMGGTGSQGEGLWGTGVL